MRGRERLARHPRSAPLALLVVMVLAAGCGASTGRGDSSIPPVVQATAPPAPATTAPLSRTPVPEPTTPVERIATPSVPPTMGAATPVRLEIPAIDVDSDLMGLGLQADGTLEVPPTGFPAGWYTGAPTPGELGPAIIAGHVDWGGEPGVFYDLRHLAPGDTITIGRQDGSTAQFRVDRVEHFPKDQFPTQQVYADLDHAGLRLITCSGDFDRTTRSYQDNFVVFASLISTAPGP